jgi:hypothetical protein
MSEANLILIVCSFGLAAMAMLCYNLCFDLMVVVEAFGEHLRKFE